MNEYGKSPQGTITPDMLKEHLARQEQSAEHAAVASAGVDAEWFTNLIAWLPRTVDCQGYLDAVDELHNSYLRNATGQQNESAQLYEDLFLLHRHTISESFMIDAFGAPFAAETQRAFNYMFIHTHAPEDVDIAKMGYLYRTKPLDAIWVQAEQPNDEDFPDLP